MTDLMVLSFLHPGVNSLSEYWNAEHLEQQYMLPVLCMDDYLEHMDDKLIFTSITMIVWLMIMVLNDGKSRRIDP